MKYIKNWNNYHKIEEAVVSSQDSLNLLNSIQKNPTLPLLMINTSKNNAPYVKLLQDTLKSQGYELEINGVFDEKTKQAVIDYQSSDGLTKDGKVGRNTWKSILALNDINVEPKITNQTASQTASQNAKPASNNTTNKPNETPTQNTTTTPTNNDFTFKNQKGEVKKFSDLQKTKIKWEKEPKFVASVIENNKDNKRFILEFNKLYKEKTDRDLISFLTDDYSRSYLGGRAFAIGVNLFDIITNYIADPILDAKIFNFCVAGGGTEDELVELMLNKRGKMSEDYKKKILAAYEENYGNSFSEDMKDDGVDGNLIKKIDSDYFDTES